MNGPITDEEIRHVVTTSMKGAEAEVILGLLNRILDLQHRLSALEGKSEN